MSEALKSGRNLKLFNRMNKCIKQGITDMQNKDHESAANYFNMAIKTADNLTGIADDPFKTYFSNISSGLKSYLETKNEDTLTSTKPESVHSQLWSVHKKLCDTFEIPYEEDVDAMDAIINQLIADGKVA